MNEYGDHSEDVLEKWEVAEASRAVVRAGFWKLMDKIAGKEEDLVSIENYQLLEYMEHNEQLFTKVAAPRSR